MGTLERFWQKVRKTDNCWVWTAAINNCGYGAFSYNKDMKGIPAHRASYMLFVGEIPKGKQVDHLCMNRKCVNPEHLELVSSQENTLRSPNTRASKNSKKTHCDNGHKFTKSNTYLYKADNSRNCRTCRRAAVQKYQSRSTSWAQ